jgi:hypothetical protein
LLQRIRVRAPILDYNPGATDRAPPVRGILPWRQGSFAIVVGRFG